MTLVRSRLLCSLLLSRPLGKWLKHKVCGFHVHGMGGRLKEKSFEFSSAHTNSLNH